MAKKSKILSCAVVFALTGFVGVGATDVYQLDPVTVTAERTNVTDLDTPAAIEVLYADQIAATGANNVQESLKYSTGIIASGQGPKGLSQGTMFAKAVIRGVEKGTLVLVDGVPMNQSGMYQLQDISTDAVEKIEVVRGGGAVLYGSEASGGVINIITKGKRDTKIKAGIGNYGQQNYAVSVQGGDNFGVTYVYDRLGSVDHISDPSGGRPTGMYYNVTRGERNNLNWRYNLTDDLYFTHSYSHSNSHYVYRWDGSNGKNKDAVGQDVFYKNDEHMAALHYGKNDLTGNFYYHKRNMTTDKSKVKKENGPNTDVYDPTQLEITKTENKDQSIGVDFSNRWHYDKGSFMIGGDFRRDMADIVETGKSTKHYTRNMYSLFGQLGYDFSELTRANFNFRQTWVGKDGAGNKYDKFTPEIIVMHDLDDNTMIYAKAGKSFMMPTFKQLYGGGNVIASPELKPQSGTHYEVGAKKNVGKSSWRIAAFRYNIKDSLEAKDISKKKDFSKIGYANEDIRNTGLEIEWKRNQSENLSYRLGATFGHPEKKERSAKGKLGNWHDYYGKIQLNGGVTYTTGKLTTSFNFSHLGKRIRDSDPYNSFKSQFFTSLNFSYRANENCRAFLNIDNVLNRQDIISSSSSSFYNLGRNFMAGVEYKF
ncbi:MAG: TonB-dependent receptor [Dialister sp.]|nr:TonB-dependent receptor [Dialister sp.]